MGRSEHASVPIMLQPVSVACVFQSTFPGLVGGEARCCMELPGSVFCLNAPGRCECLLVSRNASGRRRLAFAEETRV